IFVYDRQSGQITRASVDSNGTQANGESARPSVSDNGRFVAFESAATNLAAGDLNGHMDIFVHDLVSAATVLVSNSSAGAAADSDCTQASISASGRYVAFLSRASNLAPGTTNGLANVYRHDRDPDANGTFDEPGTVTQRGSITWDNNAPNADCDWPTIALD